MSEPHHRMPVMLVKDEWNQWFDPTNENTGALKVLLVPYPDDAIDIYEVRKAVNNVKNNSPDLLCQLN